MKLGTWETLGGYPCGYYLQRILHNMRMQLDDMLSPYDITSQQARILGYIHIHRKNGETVCQRDLEEEAGLRGSSVTSLLQGLEKKGFVIRSASGPDGRVKRLSLTDKGIELDGAIHGIFRRVEDRILGGMTKKERGEFLALLKTAYSNMEEHTAACRGTVAEKTNRGGE